MKRSFLLVFSLLVVVVGVVLASESCQKIILKTNLPATPSKVPYYTVVGEVEEFYISEELMIPKKTIPSKTKALEIGGKFLYGKLPKEAYLSKVETIYLKALNTRNGKIVDKKPLFVLIKYKRKINGLEVIGPADEIEVAVSDKILFYSKNWRKLKYEGIVSVISSKEALEKLKKGEIVNKPMCIAYPITVHNIKLGYYASGKDRKSIIQFGYSTARID